MPSLGHILSLSSLKYAKMHGSFLAYQQILAKAKDWAAVTSDGTVPYCIYYRELK